MIKTKKLKISLILLSIMAAVILLFTTQASYASDSNDVTDSNDDVVIGTVEGINFTNYEGFYNLCFGTFESRQSLTIHIQNNFNFHKNCCHVNNGRTFNFIIDENKWLFSTDANSMFDVGNGNLILNCEQKPESKSPCYAYVSEPGESSAINVFENGHIQADHIWFREPYEGKEGPSEGGVFYFDNVSKTQNFSNCYFDHNKADEGGSIYVDDIADKDHPQNFIFDNCKFEGCQSVSKGGAIYNDAKKINMQFNNVKFVKCNSSDDGGAIYSNGNYENYEFNDCEINSCSANDDGGAIYNYSNPSTYTFNHSKLCQCFSERGGAIASIANNENFVFNDTDIDSCAANGDGGAIYNDSNPSTYTFNNSKLYKCHSNEDGGAIASIGSNENYYFNNSNIDSCSANEDGGAIYVSSCNCKISGITSSSLSENPISYLNNKSSIVHCSSNHEGGAIYTSSTPGWGNNVHIEKLNFIDNHIPDHSGAALELSGEHNYVDSCYFRQNCKYNKDKSDWDSVVDFFRAGWYDLHGSMSNCEFDNLRSSKIQGVLTCGYVLEHCEKNRVFIHGDREIKEGYPFSFTPVHVDD